MRLLCFGVLSLALSHCRAFGVAQNANYVKVDHHDEGELGSDKKGSKVLRRCDSLELTPGDNLDLYELPGAFEGRVPVPFTFHMVPSSSPATAPVGLDIYIGTGELYQEEKFYVISLGPTEVTVSKVDGRRNRIRTLETAPSKLMPTAEAKSKSYYFRVKAREQYTMLGIYEAGEDGSEPILSYKDLTPPADTLTHYGFSVESVDRRAKVHIEHNCRAALKSFCIHPAECTVEGSTCPFHGMESKCTCDDEHIVSKDGRMCVTNPIKIGEECTSSKQCYKLDAKCEFVC